MLPMLYEDLAAQRPFLNRDFAERVAHNVAQSLAAFNSGDAQEHEVRSRHPEARYRDPHPVFCLMTSLLTWACEQGASAIFLRPGKEQVEVQFQVEGHRKPATTLPLSLHEALTNRLRDAASLTGISKTSATAQPNSGSFPARWNDQTLRVDVTFVPLEREDAVEIRLSPQ